MRPWKAPLEDDDLGPVDPATVGVLAGELDRALVRLGARVAEEDPAAEARLGEPLGSRIAGSV